MIGDLVHQLPNNANRLLLLCAALKLVLVCVMQLPLSYFMLVQNFSELQTGVLGPPLATPMLLRIIKLRGRRVRPTRYAPARVKKITVVYRFYGWKWELMR